MAQNADFFTGQLPLKGVILCCTSLPQDVRTNLAEVASQMGAVHQLDLTCDVTHLIVGSITTPKYRYVAKERPDVKVLHPEWLEAVRKSWMEGGEVEIEALEKEHRFPVFTGLHICVTGFADMAQRDSIEATVKEHGAQYHGDLTKVVTHLIAAAPEGEKYKFGKQWGIRIVSLKWFEDSLGRGMALDERFYDPVMPVEEQGVGAFRLYPKQRTSLGKHGREGEEQKGGGDDPGRKKLRRTASSRLEGHSQDMWSDMSVLNTTMEPSESDQWRDDGNHSRPPLSNSNSKPTMRTRSSTVGSLSTAASEAGQEPEALFSGHHVLIHGFEHNKTALLGQVLQQNRATIVHSSTELEQAAHLPFFKRRYLLVPHVVPSAPFEMPDVPTTTTVATEWWVERCIHYKRLLNPAEDVLSQPLWNSEASGFADLLISTTGFVGVDLRQVAEAVKLVGATYQEKVLPNSTVLVSASASVRKEKAYYASKHNIPVVSAEWLWTSLKTKRAALFEDFKLELPAFELSELTGELSTSSPAASGTLRAKSNASNKEKDEVLPKRLSNVRKKHATPSLSLKATKSDPNIGFPRSRHILHEDEDDSPFVDCEPIPLQTARAVTKSDSQPLREISPNLSPRKISNESTTSEADGEVVDGTAKKQSSRSPSPRKARLPLVDNHSQEPQPPIRPHHELTADLAELLNQHMMSRPSSAAPVEPPQRRKNRPLGRASSGISNRSHSFPLSAQSQSENALPFSPLTDIPESVSHSRSVEAQSVPLSTQLGYDTPEAEAHRLQMSKKMGTKVQDEYAGIGMRRVASLGVVRDSSLIGNAGVGNRVKGRKGRA